MAGGDDPGGSGIGIPPSSSSYRYGPTGSRAALTLGTVLAGAAAVLLRRLERRLSSLAELARLALGTALSVHVPALADGVAVAACVCIVALLVVNVTRIIQGEDGRDGGGGGRRRGVEEEEEEEEELGEDGARGGGGRGGGAGGMPKEEEARS